MKIEKLPPIFRDEASLILKNKINELIDAFNLVNQSNINHKEYMDWHNSVNNKKEKPFLIHTRSCWFQ